jgi:hypothetical protein
MVTAKDGLPVSVSGVFGTFPGSIEVAEMSPGLRIIRPARNCSSISCLDVLQAHLATARWQLENVLLRCVACY